MAEKILSVGIDIGTSTTQLVFSLLTIENVASAFNVPRIIITDKEVIYKSDIIHTPLLEETRVNQKLIQQFVKKNIKKPGLKRKKFKPVPSSLPVKQREKKMRKKYCKG